MTPATPDHDPATHSLPLDGGIRISDRCSDLASDVASAAAIDMVCATCMRAALGGGWHATSKLLMPPNITPILLPSRAPELNPVENVWQYMRANWLSNRIFENYDAIIEAICEAWNNLMKLPETIKSIGMGKWVQIGQSE